MQKRLMTVLTLLIIALTGVTLYFTSGYKHTAEMIAVENDMPAAGSASIGGSFALTNQDGKAMSDADFHGKVMLVFFGFTNCPDVCPTTMAVITNVMEKLGADASKVAPILITVDPKRDTPDVLKKYVAKFHPAIVGLTGTQEQINQAVDAYKVYAAKKEPEKTDDHAHHGGDDYQVDHSGFIYLMDKDGKYVNHFRHEDPEQTLVDAIRKQL